MKSKLDMIQEVGARRALALTGASFALYAVAMLTVTLLAEPSMDGAATTADASASAKQVVLHVDALTPTELDII